MSKTKVLFVCLGNICRSPLAEGIFKKKVADQGLSNEFFIDSCGTAGYHIGERPDSRSVANAAQNGVYLDSRARQFDTQDFDDFDYILAMDRSNLKNIQSLERGDGSYHLSLMRDFDSLGEGQDVPDPYYGGERGFQEVFDILDRATDGLLEHIQQHKA